jgi:hypothetical protein
VGDGRLKLFGNPCVQALAGETCRHVDLSVKIGWDASDELARERLVRLLSPFLTECQVVVDRVVECLPQLGNALALERDYVAGIHDLAVEDVGLVVEIDLPDYEDT